MGNPRTASDRDQVTQAFPGVRTRICRGCGRVFTLSRRTQQHCRPSCRQFAHQRRQASTDLFSVVADAIEPEVIRRLTTE